MSVISSELAYTIEVAVDRMLKNDIHPMVATSAIKDAIDELGASNEDVLEAAKELEKAHTGAEVILHSIIHA